MVFLFVFYALLDLCAGRVICRQILQLLRESVNIFQKLFICHLNTDTYGLQDLILVGGACIRRFFFSPVRRLRMIKFAAFRKIFCKVSLALEIRCRLWHPVFIHKY